jgi:predicted glycosyltransferase
MSEPRRTTKVHFPLPAAVSKIDIVTRYLFSSHDGFGLGHVRRNLQIARAVLDADPSAEVTVITGVAAGPPWLHQDDIEVIAVPPLLKGHDGVYRNSSMSFTAAIGARAEVFLATIEARRPDVVVVDRHPFGIAGELRAGLEAAHRRGARTVLGLRDVIDDPATVADELSGAGWNDVPSLFSDVLVYGERSLCDHVAEYGLPVEPTYCGWVTAPVAAQPIESQRLVVAAGGGGDAHTLLTLAAELLGCREDWNATVIAGPYLAGDDAVHPSVRSRLSWRSNVDGCAPFFAAAGAVLQMAGYNSVAESVAAGSRPLLVPRRSPRREQAIRASRLAALGLADVVDAGAGGSEIAWLLDQPRRLAPNALAGAGIRLDGAQRAAAYLARHAPVCS